MDNNLKITIDGKVYNIKLDDNDLAKQIITLCPFEDEFQRYGEHEYYCRLQKDFSKIDTPKTTKTYKNKLYYFSGWNALSIVFEDSDISPYEVVYIGEIIENTVPQLKNSFDKVNVKIEE